MASTKLRISGQTGVEIYAVIRDEDDKVWDGTSFVTFDISDKDDYDVSLTEQGSTGYYSASFPSSIESGRYHITYHQRLVSGEVDLTTPDDVVHQEIKVWDGTTIVNDLVTQASITDICNMALSHLAISKEISNFETDTNQEAKACRRFFTPVVEKTLREFPWQFATQFQTLGLVAEDPTTEWNYSYRYPSDCLMIRRILGTTRNPSYEQRTPYRLARDSSGLLIYTDMEDAILEYTIRDLNPAFWPPDFELAVSWLLAWYIAPRLTGGNNRKLKDDAIKGYQFEMAKARAATLNEVKRDVWPDAETIRARS
jgi:hypothetical protein